MSDKRSEVSDFLVLSLHDRLHAPHRVRRPDAVAQRGRLRHRKLPDRVHVDSGGPALTLRAARRRGGGRARLRSFVSKNKKVRWGMLTLAR